MYRILIADDEPMALYSTAHAFPWADWGFDPPVLMTEAPAALDKLRAERFDAVALSAVFRRDAAAFLRAALAVETVEQHLADALAV